MRELTWGLHAVSGELAHWRRLALAIPDPVLRQDAVSALASKRGHIDGAALFTILPRRRDRNLLRTLTAYALIVDFLDNVHERHPEPTDGVQLHHALVDAVDPDGTRRDYYRFHPRRDDGGYLVALVTACQEGCRALPSFPRVRALARREAERNLVLGLNHEPDPAKRDPALRAWAARYGDGAEGLAWFEVSGAASATMAILGLLTLAADPGATAAAARATQRALWPWGCLATTMLDSYADQIDDRINRDHSYIAHYPDVATATSRTSYALVRALEGVSRLPRPRRQTLIVGCMAALYLSKRGLRTAELAASTRALAASGGTLVRVLISLLRAWRLAYRQWR